MHRFRSLSANRRLCSDNETNSAHDTPADAPSSINVSSSVIIEAIAPKSLAFRAAISLSLAACNSPQTSRAGIPCNTWPIRTSNRTMLSRKLRRS